MGYKDILAGEYIATPAAARIIESKNGTVGIEVAFDFDGETLNWVGWLSEKAMKRSMETLVDLLGYNGSEDVSFGGTLTDPKVLDFSRQVKIVVEMESNQEGTKSYPKIKWVNAIGGSGFGAVEPQAVKSKLAGLGFRAAFLAAKQGNPVTKEPSFNSDESLPF